MTQAEKIARMQTKRTPRKEAVWQLPNGKWKHVYNSEIEWSERSSAEVDYRFTVESDPATYDFDKRAKAA